MPSGSSLASGLEKRTPFANIPLNLCVASYADNVFDPPLYLKEKLYC